jgi:hypothetical protein
MGYEPLAITQDKNAINKLAVSVPAAQGGSTQLGGANTTDITSTTFNNPTLVNSQSLASQYGYNVDKNSILNELNSATNAQYDANKAAAMQTEAQSYSDINNTMRSQLDLMRKANAESVMSGAAKGAAAANKLSTMLGATQGNSELLTQLAQARNQQEFDRNADLAKNVTTADETVQTRLADLAAKANELYGYDTQGYAAALQAAMGYQQGAMNLEGTKYTADQELAGTKYSSDSSLTGTKYTADKQLAGVKDTNKTNVKTTKLTTKSNEKIAGKTSSKKKSSSSSKKSSSGTTKNTPDTTSTKEAQKQQNQKSGAVKGDLTEAQKKKNANKKAASDQNQKSGAVKGEVSQKTKDKAAKSKKEAQQKEKEKAAKKKSTKASKGPTPIKLKRS